MAKDLSESRLSLRAPGVWTAETLHGWWTLRTPEPMGVKLSLKLYHARELPLDYQQLMMEAPLLSRSELPIRSLMHHDN
jgi:hypothetical protein